MADFYGIEELCPVMRVVSVTLFINSLVVVQRALLTANINFKTQAKATFAAVLVSGLTGLFLAYRGYGVWAIVWQQILSVAINALMLCFMTKWMPVWAFSWSSFKELFGFGSKLMLSGLLDTTYNNIKPLLVGKIFSAGDLGHYSRAEHFATFPSSNVNGVVQRVTYPVLVQLKDDDERLANNYRKLLRVSAFVIFPLMVGLAGVSNAFVRVVIGDKWTFCAELLQIICFSMMWYPVHSINLNLLQVKGRSDLFLRLEVIKKVVGLSILACSIVFGIKAMCYGAIIGGFIAIFINTYYTGKLINVGFFMQMKDLAGTFLTCMAMFALILLFNSFVPNLWAQLVGGVLLGAAFFFAVVKLLKFPELEHLSSFLKKK